MSPTSYQAAPPRSDICIIAQSERDVKRQSVGVWECGSGERPGIAKIPGLRSLDC